MKPSLEGGVNIFDTRNLHPVADNPMICFRCGEGGGETIICEMSNNAVSFERNVMVGTACELRTKTIDRSEDSDLVFKRNNFEFLRCAVITEPDTTTYNLINVNIRTRISGHHVYVGNIVNRANGFDTVYTGLNAAGDGRVDYMRWNYFAQSVDFDAPIDNTGLAITGNIIDTTHIEDVECNFPKCIKHVRVKTFEYKDEK